MKAAYLTELARFEDLTVGDVPPHLPGPARAIRSFVEAVYRLAQMREALARAERGGMGG